MAVDVVPDGRTAFASVGRISRLYNKVLLNIEEGTVVVVVGLAELQEVLAKSRTPLDWKQSWKNQLFKVAILCHIEYSPSRSRIMSPILVSKRTDMFVGKWSRGKRHAS